MIVSCPECSSKFRLASDALGDSGRKVRCSSCRHTWFQKPEKEGEINEPVENPSPVEENASLEPVKSDEIKASTFDEPSPMGDDFVEPGNVRAKRPRGFAQNKKKVKKKSKGKGLLVGWLLFLFLAGGMGYGVAEQSARIMIVDAVPQTMKLYDFLGLQVFEVGEGLAIKSETAWASRDGKKLIVISGQILNVTEEKIVVPKLLGAIRAETGEAVSRKIISPPVAYLDAKDRIDFLIELVSSKKGFQVDVDFISDDEALQNPDFDPVEE